MATQDNGSQHKETRDPQLSVPLPPTRSLQVYAVDPSAGKYSRNRVTVRVPWERLDPGPTGSKIAVIDCSNGERPEDKIVLINPKIMHGTPCFAGTRVPVSSLFEYLEGGYTIDYFLRQFPTVKREQVVALLEAAKGRAEQDCHASTR